MANRCERAISAYLSTLKGEFYAEPTDGGCIIVTPFLRSDNEAIELRLSQLQGDRFEITDDASTVDYLYVNGVNVDGRPFAERLRIIARRFNVQIEGDAVRVVTDLDHLGDGLQRLLGAVQDINYLIYTRPKGGPSTFEERVEKLLISKNVKYQRDFPIQGHTDRHVFRFFANSRNSMPIEPMTAKREAVARARAQQLAYHILDIRKAAPQQYSFLAILDDSPSGLDASIWQQPEIANPLKYCDKVLLWSDRERLSTLIMTD